MSQNEREQRQALIRRVRDRFRISKVVCTRGIKGRDAEVFVGMSGGFAADSESVQDDMAGGMTEPTDQDGTNASTLDFNEARIAALLLGLHVDRLAYERAAANGTLTHEAARDRLQAAEQNYGTLLLEEIDRGKG